jgi:hypothetical protein
MGSWLDRFDRGRLMILDSVLRGAAFASIPLVAIFAGLGRASSSPWLPWLQPDQVTARERRNRTPGHSQRPAIPEGGCSRQ